MIFVQPPNKQIHDETLKMVNPFEVLSVLVDYCPGKFGVATRHSHGRTGTIWDTVDGRNPAPVDQ